MHDVNIDTIVPYINTNISYQAYDRDLRKNTSINKLRYGFVSSQIKFRSRKLTILD